MSWFYTSDYNFQWLADSRTQFGDDRYNKTKAIKVMPPAVRARADELSTVWDFGVSCNDNR